MTYSLERSIRSALVREAAMRKMLAGAVALPILFASYNSFAGGGFGGGAFASGMAQGYQQGQMQQLCLQAMQNYVRGAGPMPPAFCGATAAPPPPQYRPSPRVTCDTQHFGNGYGPGTWNETTCR